MEKYAPSANKSLLLNWTTEGCTLRDNIRKEDIRKELPLLEQIRIYRTKWIQYLERMEDSLMSKRTYKYRLHLLGKDPKEDREGGESRTADYEPNEVFPPEA